MNVEEFPQGHWKMLQDYVMQLWNEYSKHDKTDLLAIKVREASNHEEAMEIIALVTDLYYPGRFIFAVHGDCIIKAGKEVMRVMDLFGITYPPIPEELRPYFPIEQKTSISDQIPMTFLETMFWELRDEFTSILSYSIQQENIVKELTAVATGERSITVPALVDFLNFYIAGSTRREIRLLGVLQKSQEDVIKLLVSQGLQLPHYHPEET